MAHQLSEGSLPTVMGGGLLENLVLQVIGLKKIASNNTGSDKERFRLLLSDGVHFISHAMLTTQYNDQHSDIPLYSVIKVKKYITSIIGDKAKGKAQRRVMVILEMDLVANGDEIKQRLGNPQPLSDEIVESLENNPPINSSSSISTPSSTKYQETKPAMERTLPSVAAPVQHDLNQSVLSDQLTHPISSLSPYQNKWVIKARVTNKSGIRTWSNSRGEGKLFSMDLVDESGEIRATAFTQMVDKYYDMIEVDKVYYISKCQLKPANKQYTTLKNDYEMTFTNETIVQQCYDDVQSIPSTKFNFVTIDKLANAEPGNFVDIIGVCKHTSDLQTFTARSTGRELKKKEVVIVDSTNVAVSLTLWGTDAEKFDGSTNPVIAIKGGKIAEFNGGKNLSMISSSVMKTNPDIPEAHRLTGWFENCGGNVETVNLSATTGGGGFAANWLSFQEVINKGLGHGEKGDYYQTKGIILLVRPENSMYKSCPTDDCKKKVVDMENGMFRCEKCNREYPNFKYRLLVNLNLGDWSRNQWVSVFNEEAEKIFGKSAQVIGEEKDMNPDSMMSLCDATNFKEFIFKCRAKIESYSDEHRLKTVAVKVDPINYKEYNAHLLSRINYLLTN